MGGRSSKGKNEDTTTVTVEDPESGESVEVLVQDVGNEELTHRRNTCGLRPCQPRGVSASGEAVGKYSNQVALVYKTKRRSRKTRKRRKKHKTRKRPKTLSRKNRKTHVRSKRRRRSRNTTKQKRALRGGSINFTVTFIVNFVTDTIGVSIPSIRVDFNFLISVKNSADLVYRVDGFELPEPIITKDMLKRKILEKITPDGSDDSLYDDDDGGIELTIPNNELLDTEICNNKQTHIEVEHKTS